MNTEERQVLRYNETLGKRHSENDHDFKGTKT